MEQEKNTDRRQIKNKLIDKINLELKYKIFPEVLLSINNSNDFLSESERVYFNFLAYNGCSDLDDFLFKVSQSRPYQINLIRKSKPYLDLVYNYIDNQSLEMIKKDLLKYSNLDNQLFLTYKDFNQPEIKYLHRINEQIFSPYEYVAFENRGFFITNTERLFYNQDFNEVKYATQLLVPHKNHIFEIIGDVRGYNTHSFIRVDNNNWKLLETDKRKLFSSKIWEINSSLKTRNLTALHSPFFATILTKNLDENYNNEHLGFFEIMDDILKVGCVSVMKKKKGGKVYSSTPITEYFNTDFNYKVKINDIDKIYQFEDSNIFVFKLKHNNYLVFYNDDSKLELEKIKLSFFDFDVKYIRYY